MVCTHAASLARQVYEYDPQSTSLIRFRPVLERYSVSGRATAVVTTADGTAQPLDVRPRIFLLVQTERGQTLL